MNQDAAARRPLPGAIADSFGARAQSAAGFRSAQRMSMRYSRFAGAMKFVLPAFAAILIALVVAWPQLRSGGNHFRMGYSATTPEDVTPRMVNARFTGVDGAERPFTVTSVMATRTSAKSPTVDLDAPKADVTLGDGSWVALSSTSGTYNETTHDLELRDKVSLFHDSGYEFHTAIAHINMGDGTAYGDAPVKGQGPFGLLTSDGFRVRDNGKTVIFTGTAKLIIFPGATGPAR